MNPLVTDVHTSDPAVLVHDGTAYLYTGHDEAEPDADAFLMRDWLCFSSRDLLSWEAHGSPLALTDFSWAAATGAKAGTVVEHGGRFWWYVAVNHGERPGGAIGVAVSDGPTGPFRDALGAALVTDDIPYPTGSAHTIDPSVIVVDGRAHLFWGKYRCFHARLDASMTALDGPVREIDLPEFQEGAHVYRYGDRFHLLYGYRHPQRVAYARAGDIDGPWEFAGLVSEVPGNCATNRPAVARFDDEWIFFYHNGILPGGGSRRRSVCADRLSHDADGRVRRVHMTTEGLSARRPL